MKKYYTQYNVGKVKYLVSFHDGVKKHDDGSDFFDIKCLKSLKKLQKFISDLIDEGYSLR